MFVHHTRLIDGTVVVGVSPYVDEHDRPVKRTPDLYPYNYDSYIRWRTRANVERSSGVYSDRLLQQDYELTNRLWKEHCNNLSYREVSSTALTDFLRARLNKPELQIVYLMECCNQSSGFPIWYVCYYTPGSERT